MPGVAVAAIKISQTGLLPTPAGEARRDVVVGVPVTLRNGDDSGVTKWSWMLLYKPPGSTATLINPNSAVANITPDLDGGTYHVQLAVNLGRPAFGELKDIVFRVPDAAGFAAPAAGERGAASNYIVDGVQNTWGWTDEFNRRYLYSYDNRGAPVTASIVAGNSHDFEFDWPLHDAVLQLLEIKAPGTTSMDVMVATEATFSNIVYRENGVDPTNIFRSYVHRTLTWPATGLAAKKVYLRITNNDADESFEVSLRLGAL